MRVRDGSYACPVYGMGISNEGEGWISRMSCVWNGNKQ
jgi:hypothetical protein